MERTASDAEDLVQDTLERALRSWQRFVPGTNLRCWLHTIMHNLFLDRCRARNRREAIARDVAETTVEPARDGDCRLGIDQSDRRPGFSRGLRPALRDAVELVFFCGLNYEQAAGRLQIAKATVGTRLLRARRQLRHHDHRAAGERPGGHHFSSASSSSNMASSRFESTIRSKMTSRGGSPDVRGSSTKPMYWPGGWRSSAF